MEAHTLLTFILASTALTFVPGPDNIFVLTQSALHGRRGGILITLGLCTGLIVHTSAAAFGISAIFMASTKAFNLLKVTGAFYLLYLAWKMLRSTSTSLEGSMSPTLSTSALYRRGIIMNITNPKVAIFFLAFLPQFTSEENGPISIQLLTFGAIFIFVTLIIFSFIAIMSGFIAQWFKTSPSTQRRMNQLASLVFFGLAVRLVTSSR